MDNLNGNMDVSGQPKGWLTLTRKISERIMCAVLAADIVEFLDDQSWGQDLEVRIRLEEIRGPQVRLSILAPRKVTVMRAEIDQFLSGWNSSDGMTTLSEVSEEILFAFTRETLKREVDALEQGDPLDLLEIRVDKILEDNVKLWLGNEFRNFRFARHAEVPDDNEDDDPI